MESLLVFLQDQYVGKLLYDTGRLQFAYDAAWLQNPRKQALSLALPLRQEIFEDAVVRPYFDGLLPEESVREQVARILQKDSRNTFALLMELGGDCAGAVSLYPDSTKINISAGEYRPLSEQEAYNILHSLRIRPLGIGNGDLRISGAGAQDKLVACIFEGRLVLPLRGAPSTHIIKPAIAGYDGTVFNEYFCMQLAQRCGLQAPNTFVLKFGDEDFFVVERYDRKKCAEKWQRLHQEDFCQILGVLPECKYESDGGPGLEDCFGLLERNGLSGRDKIEFLDRVIFNFLIGNGDAHAKNFSLLYADGEARLAPCYDLISTAAMTPYYPKHKQAMKLCSSRYTMSSVRRENFAKLSEWSGFREDFILGRVDGMIKKILPIAQQLAAELNVQPNTESCIYGRILKIIRLHCDRLASE